MMRVHEVIPEPQKRRRIAELTNYRLYATYDSTTNVSLLRQIGNAFCMPYKDKSKHGQLSRRRTEMKLNLVCGTEIWL